uniref:Uncharacterized protein n=1 Tax=Clytia hemisphaerica TaxID=252671 RepID=A0A7M5UZI7_9CNID
MPHCLSVYKGFLYLSLALFTLASLLRVIANIKQHSSNELVRECFAKEDGKLIQTPWHKECLTDLDKSIAILSAAPAFIFVVSSIIYLCCYFCCKDKVDDSEVDEDERQNPAPPNV